MSTAPDSGDSGLRTASSSLPLSCLWVLDRAGSSEGASLGAEVEGEDKQLWRQHSQCHPPICSSLCLCHWSDSADLSWVNSSHRAGLYPYVLSHPHCT